MEHKLLTINHRLESYVYANAAVRTGAGGFVPGDVGRIAYQSDTGQYWRLIGTTPAWQVISSPAYAFFQGSSANPTSTNAVGADLMMGLDGTITPSATGKLLVMVSGGASNNTAGAFGLSIQLRHGAGTKPVNGAAATGIPIGAPNIIRNNANTAAVIFGFSVQGFASDMVAGTTYWLDVSLTATAGSVANLYQTAITAIELP